MRTLLKKVISVCSILCMVLCYGCSNDVDTSSTSNESIIQEAIPSVSEDSIYKEESNWAYYGVGDNKSADLFLVCPTVDMGKSGNYNMSMSDTKTKENFLGALNMERGIYEDTLRMYAPYYKQVTFPVYSLNKSDSDKYFDIAYKDVREAFLYYINNCNNNRPVVLAGFSQGSDMILRLLKEFYGNKTLSDKLVAAYCIGWRITDEDLKEYPQLKMAQGESDTGVIVSFNSEAKGLEESIILPKGTKTNSINPLNWKTDNTMADKSKNLGACFTDYSGKIVKEENSLTGAYIDDKRGSLIVTDIEPSKYSNKLFPDGVYHLYDYQFFYRNLQQNVALRVKMFK